MNRDTFFLFGMLVLMGAGWGLTQPLSKIAVSGGYRHFGLIFWELMIGGAILGVVQTVRGRGLHLTRPALRIYLFIALLGTVLPAAASFETARHLPAGIISILLSLVPLIAFPIALALGNEKFVPVRAIGLALGLGGVALIVAPEASLPDRAMAAFVPLGLVAPLFYALEGNVIGRWGTAGLDPVEVLYGASVFGILISLPLALLTGTFIDPRPPYAAPDAALVLSSLIHVVVYSAYFWMVGRAGAVFAIQVSYLVTGFGVFWSMGLLSETYSVWVWAAMALIMAGVFLVQPRPREPLAAPSGSGTFEAKG